MVKKGTQIKKSLRKQNPVITDSGKFGIYFSLFLVFIIPFLYFLIFGKHIFTYQDNLTLFVYSGEYLDHFALKPGGLLEYAGNFIAQGYFNPIIGSLILTSLFTLIAYIFLKIAEEIYYNGMFLTTLMVLPSVILMILQTDFNYQLHNTIGFLAASVYFLLVIKSKKRYLLFILLALFPVFYYLTGGYIWIFTGMYILFSLLHKNVIYPLVLILIASLTFLLFKRYLFYQPLNELAYYPLPQISYFKIPVALYSVFGLFILYPILLRVLRPVKINSENVRTMSLYIVMIFFSLTIFILSGKYDRNITNLFKLENLVYQEKWQEVIRFQEKIKSKNIIAQYYYNLALSETDQLCDRMFFGPQDFGPRSLMVQWDSKANINQIFRGAYFFYNTGLINEAHRWAFESMVMQGYRPENIKMLIKTELINGHFRIAEKYINVLKRTLRFRNLAKKYEAMLNNPDLIKDDPDMGKKISLQSGKDFLIRLKDQQANVLLLLQANPRNTKAFEYMIAWFMLERNAGKVAEEIRKMSDMGYDRIPRHIEEVALFFKSVTGVSPDFGGLKI
ncbi:MAG: hypothetical protein QG611_1085, partial [Bacteroidota bacterium]|nr:hypothetical protein [Bacteroidota bacterium]